MGQERDNIYWVRNKYGILVFQIVCTWEKSCAVIEWGTRTWVFVQCPLPHLLSSTMNQFAN